MDPLKGAHLRDCQLVLLQLLPDRVWPQHPPCELPDVLTDRHSCRCDASEPLTLTACRLINAPTPGMRCNVPHPCISAHRPADSAHTCTPSLIPSGHARSLLAAQLSLTFAMLLHPASPAS